MAERSTEQPRASARCLQLPCGCCYRQQLEDVIRQLQSKVDEIKGTADGENSEYQQERLAELQTILVDCMILRDETDQKKSCLKTIRKRGKMLRDRVAGLRSRTGKAMEYLQVSLLTICKRSAEQLEDVTRQPQSVVDEIKGTAELHPILDEIGPKPIREKVKALRDRSAELISRSDKAMEDVQGNDMDGRDDQTLPSPELLILSKSANKAAVQIMQALEDEGVNLIGLVGLPGVGKTTLVRQIVRKAKGSDLYDDVVMLHAQRHGELEKNRDAVLQKIREQKLEQKLQQRKKVLVILEDLWWENPDLKGLGLLGDDHKGRKGLKVLVTTCFPKVCTSLKCDATIKLEGLTAEEAVTLFDRLQLFILGRLIYSFQQWGERIIGASEGLPYTIVAMINGIRSVPSGSNNSANPIIWEYLKPYYDYLNELQVKIFLIISSFPEYYAPTVEEVIRYLISTQVLEGAETGTIEDIRSRAHVLISNLQANSFLSMENGTLKTTKLFPMLGHQIASGYPNFESSSQSTLDHGKRYFEDNQTFPHGRSPDPCMFFFKSSESTPSHIYKRVKQVDALTITIDTDGIPESRVSTYFGKELNVLNLRGSLSGSSSLCPSIQLSVLEKLPTTLQTLLLSCFSLSKDDMARLGKLTLLKILSFNGCDIDELPDELGKLHDLRMLDLSNCVRLPTFAPNLLERLSKLEELSISTADREVEKAASDNILMQICSLSKLTVLSIEIQFKGFPSNMVLPKLPRYKIEINTKGEKMVSFHQNRDLPASALRVMGDFPLNTFKGLLPETQHLFLVGARDLSIPNLVPHLDPDGLSALKDLKLHQCETMQCIVDMPDYKGTRSVLENLTSLELAGLRYLARLCNGEGSLIFGNLKVINISECVELRDSLLSPSVAKGLRQLEILELNSCRNLSHIARDCDHGCIPALSTIKIGFCTKLQYVFDIRIYEGNAKLKDIEITDCDALTHVFRNCIPNSSNDDDTFELPHLQRLVLTRLNKLDSICQGKDILVVPSLQEFKLEHFPTLKPFLLTHWKVARNTTEEQRTSNNSISPQLKVLETNGYASTPERHKHVITLRERSTSFSCLIVTDFQELFDDQSQCFLLNLKELKISNAFYLTTLGKDGNLMGGASQNLIRLELIQCPKLRHIFTLGHVRNVPKLKHLSIEECSQLEQIITDDQTSSGASTATKEAEPRTCFPNLVEISIKNCHELRSVFPTRFLQFPKLKSFKVESASKLLLIFAVNYSQDQGIMSQHKYLELPKLQELSLIDLKSLITFAPMDYRIGFPSLSSLKIRGCPKMETTFVTASAACVYAEREVRSRMDESSTLMKDFGQAMIPFPIFQGGDYETWHFKMKTYFLSQGLWGVVEIGSWKISGEERKKDAQALSIIVQASPSSIIGETRKAKSAKDAWVLLKECFQRNWKFDVEWKPEVRNVEPILYDPKVIMEDLFVDRNPF